MIKYLFDLFKRKPKEEGSSRQDLYEQNRLNMSNSIFNFCNKSKSVIKEFNDIYMVCSGKDKNGDYLQVWYRFVLSGHEADGQNLDSFQERVLTKFHSFNFSLNFSGHDSDGDYRSFSFERSGEDGFIAFMCCVEITREEEQVREAVKTTETLQ